MSPHGIPTASARSGIPLSSLEPSRSRWHLDTFRALRHRNYRLYFWGQLVSLTGSWVQSAALTWLAYDLTKQSNWPALVGALQVLPTSLLGVWGGSLADRWPKRSLVFLTQAALLVLALLLASLVWAEMLDRWDLLVLALIIGIVNGLDLPARLAFVIDMVGRDDLPNAIALNSMLFNTARAVGPALSAVLLPWLGASLCFLVNGLSFVAVLVALAAMNLPASPGRNSRAAPGLPTPPPPTSDGVAAAFRYLSRHPLLILLLVLSGSMSLFGWPVLSLLPALSDQRLQTGTDGYAWMLSAIGGGALVASLLVASFGSRLRRRWFLVAGVSLAASSLLGLSLVPSLVWAVPCCALLGCGLILFFATSQSIMQLSAGDHLRGRIMGIWSMILSGAHPLGHLLAGSTADRYGVPIVLALMGVGIATAAALVLLLIWFCRVGER
jgi:predicted MFS family arabinose efflux permease